MKAKNLTAEDKKRYAREYHRKKYQNAMQDFVAFLERTAGSKKVSQKMRNLAWRLTGQLQKVDRLQMIDVLAKVMTISELEKKANIV